MRRVFVSNALSYTGPGVVTVLVRGGYTVLCHDPAFADANRRAAFSRDHQATALDAPTPEAIVDELAEGGGVDGVVLNDVHPNRPKPFEDIALDELRAAHAALVEFPFRLCQLLLPPLKAKGRGSIVFITSARQLQPEPGFAVATSVRAGATALALALAREAAPHGIQVNAVQPNYLYSEAYYPRARFIDDAEGREAIARMVPTGRLGTPEEVGELVEFYVSGRSPFTTGQVVNFTGGWP